MNTNPLIECECGCGIALRRFDVKGRPRRFILGHSARLQLSPRNKPERFKDSLPALLNCLRAVAVTESQRAAIAVAISLGQDLP